MWKGCSISNEEWAIIVEKNDLWLAFDKEIKMKNGYMCEIILAIKPDDNYCFATIGEGGRQDINDLHKKFGYMSKMIVWAMTKHYNWPLLTNKFVTCKSCALAKSCQKNRNKELSAQSKTPSKMLFIDISSIKDQSFGRSKSCSLQWTMPPISHSASFSSQKIKQQQQWFCW